MKYIPGVDGLKTMYICIIIKNNYRITFIYLSKINIA